MDRPEVERVLAASEAALAEGSQPDMKAFWRVVAALKRDPELVETYGERVAAVDRGALVQWALLVVPGTIGTALMVLGTIVGLFFVLLAYYVDEPLNGLLLLLGTGVTLVTTHGLAHLAVGRLFGIRFTDWFIGKLQQPQPSVKVEYASYLAASPRRRAWMHASGAIVTKIIPLFALGPALVIGVQGWVTAVLIALTVIMVLTDVLFSTKSSDWKKFRRELRYATGG